MDGADRRSTITLPNGVVVTYGYDGASRLSSLSYARSGVSLGNITYEYDANGRRLSMGGSLARTELPPALTSATYNAANQLTNWSGTTLTYDANGNLVSDGSSTLTWSVRDDLTSIGTASFGYDAMGRRISRTVGGNTVGFLLDAGSVVQEQGSSTANYLLGPAVDEVLARAEGSTTVSPIVDGLGSTVALVDSLGTSQTQYSYEPFGFAVASGSSSSNGFQFTGRENDGTGLMYYRTRYYSPRVQRFVSEDPLGFAAGDVNLYAYVGNASTNATDPSGMLAPLVVAAPTLGGILLGTTVELLTPFALFCLAAPDQCGIQEQRSPQPRPKEDPRRGPPPPRPPAPPPLCSESGDPNEPHENHHLMSQELQAQFQRRELDIEQFLYRMPRSAHRLLPFGIHTGPDNWNRQWEQYFQRNPGANRDDVLRQLRRMMEDFGLCP